MSRPPQRGRFVTFEGIDGAGKSTHIAPIADHLRARGLTVVVTREPGGTELADGLRHWLLTHEMSPRTEALLAFGARSDHVERVIRPALAAGYWVLCDRFTDSTFAYQGSGRELGDEAIATLAHWTLDGFGPDRTYWFALDPAVAASRRQAARASDRFEREREAFFQRVDRCYAALAAAEPQRIRRIDAGLAPERIAAILCADLDDWCARLVPEPGSGTPDWTDERD
ncbi:MAG: dTMP kinase [Burkholderiaceae bacterium]